MIILYKFYLIIKVNLLTKTYIHTSRDMLKAEVFNIPNMLVPGYQEDINDACGQGVNCFRTVAYCV